MNCTQYRFIPTGYKYVTIPSFPSSFHQLSYLVVSSFLHFRSTTFIQPSFFPFPFFANLHVSYFFHLLPPPTPCLLFLSSPLSLLPFLPSSMLTFVSFIFSCFSLSSHYLFWLTLPSLLIPPHPYLPSPLLLSPNTPAFPLTPLSTSFSLLCQL